LSYRQEQLELSLTAFEKGKLNIAAHAREELARAGIKAQSIQCKSGGTQTHPDIARLIVMVDGSAKYVDFKTREVEDCESTVAGVARIKIARLVDRI
jgi:hypothetical protein